MLSSHGMEKAEEVRKKKRETNVQKRLAAVSEQRKYNWNLARLKKICDKAGFSKRELPQSPS